MARRAAPGSHSRRAKRDRPASTSQVVRATSVAAASQLPPPARRPFVTGIAHPAHTGLEVGRGQAGARFPAGTPAALVPRLEHLIHDVFAHAYIAAMRPTLGISVALLIAGALGCLLLRRSPAPAVAPQPGPPPHAAGTRPARASAPASQGSLR